ncbi:unnamed protein product [Protopolystoma xenopodis]|uniref:Uncharacterized protein n=1 Tax=Protopolystoma xenopodis TaxID=117903 RepID=A0A448XF54_9PLAT|nr:unnamed protein product [Protopolystoma xenopodis]
MTGSARSSSSGQSSHGGGDAAKMEGLDFSVVDPGSQTLSQIYQQRETATLSRGSLQPTGDVRRGQTMNETLARPSRNGPQPTMTVDSSSSNNNLNNITEGYAV